MASKDIQSPDAILPTPPEHLRGLPILVGGEALIERTLERIFAADTPEQVLADPDAYGVRNLAGRVVILRAVVGIMPSTIREGDWYVVLEAARPDTGEVMTLTSGSAYVVAAAVKMHRSGWLPRRVRILEMDSASNPGQSSLWLVDAPEGKDDPAMAATRERYAQRAAGRPVDTSPTVPASAAGDAF